LVRSQALGRRRGSPPGSLRSPARSWLTTLGPKPNACDHFSRGAFQAQEWRGAGNGARIAGGAPMAKAGPAGPQVAASKHCAHVKGARDPRSSSAKRGSAPKRARVARREAPAVSGNGDGAIGFCAFRRAIPSCLAGSRPARSIGVRCQLLLVMPGLDPDIQ
jgi:hypothetical protein